MSLNTPGSYCAQPSTLAFYAKVHKLTVVAVALNLADIYESISIFCNFWQESQYFYFPKY